jgi:hypothetical protein
MVCEACYAQLQDPQEPACLRPVALEALALATVGQAKASAR